MEPLLDPPIGGFPLEIEELPSLTELTPIDNQELREYVITLKEYQDLYSFYNDMETPGGDLYIPSREVTVAERRPISRNTHYYLTAIEAKQIKDDPRVESIDLTYTEKGSILVPLGQYSDYWSKGSTTTQSDKNWGLFRSYNGTATAGWGSDGTANSTGTIEITNNGRNVDVVICDGIINPAHPEFAVNEDGTGGSRVIQYNWFQHNFEVRGISSGTYVYNQLDSSNDAHGTHVAGIAVGNTQGWARKANIYNISPYSTNSNGAVSVIDYIRAFHNAKPINSVTGRKNPTIVNYSWGIQASRSLGTVYYMGLQGSTYGRPNAAQSPVTDYGWSPYRAQFGLIAASVSDANTMLYMSRDSALDTDVAEATAAGIIQIGAAGNFYMYNDVSTGTNYNNAFIVPNFVTLAYEYYYYMRGPSPGASPGVISVSAIDHTVLERKADYSNAGPRTDVFAPGSNITSSYPTGTADPRNASYYIAKSSGTSMATPQVAGVLACALETYQLMTSAEALTYIVNYSSKNQLSNPADGAYPFINYNSLLHGPNYYLKYKQEKPTVGMTYPKQNYTIRPTSGRTYPRVKRRLVG
jgi:hypothetical protein